MKKITGILFIICCLVLSGIAWVQYQPTKPHLLKFIVPKGWPQPVYDFKNNPPTEEGFQLGRKLFYDGRLSKDGNFPCASCHQQFAAFATYDHELSHGHNNHFSFRNAPPLFNLAWKKDFMWDGGINHLDLQPLAPITDTNEMAENLDSVMLKLRSDTVYKRMFTAAFGSSLINTKRVMQALSQFLVMIVSNNSYYDKVMRGEATFTLPQKLGYEIYISKCASCHAAPLMTNYSYKNIGLQLDDFLKDVGRMRITSNPSDSLKFMVPSLRNVQLTSPYGHDGRFYALINLFDFYRSGTQSGPTLDSSFVHGMSLSNYEIGQLTAFLYTLTDSSLINNPRFAAPGFENRIMQPPSSHEH